MLLHCFPTETPVKTNNMEPKIRWSGARVHSVIEKGEGYLGNLLLEVPHTRRT
jgi:hypothetical protein